MHGPRCYACLLRFPHLMHLNCFTKSLHFSDCCFLLFSSPLSQLDRGKLFLPLLLNGLGSWPLPSVFHPHPLLPLPIHLALPFPSKTNSRILVMVFFSFSVLCAFTCFTSRSQFFSTHSVSTSQNRHSFVRILLLRSNASSLPPLINEAHILCGKWMGVAELYHNPATCHISSSLR